MGSLETEDSDFLTEANLKKGQSVLLKFKGKKYTSTVVEIYGKRVCTDFKHEFGMLVFRIDRKISDTITVINSYHVQNDRGKINSKKTLAVTKKQSLLSEAKLCTHQRRLQSWCPVSQIPMYLKLKEMTYQVK